ncbi:MAG: hypothetical protein K5896_02435 [Prevotella sp.]|nr:hypothetical protein [Prevotella sp.]
MKIVYLIFATLLLLCLAPMPCGYYQLVRFVAMVAFGVMAFKFHQEKMDVAKCGNWGLHTVDQVYAWVKSRHLADCKDDYRKSTMQRMLKIASFHDPELTRLIPHVKQKANRGIKLSQPKRKKIIEPINVQLGDVLRWNYTGEEGVVVGFDYEEGVRKFIVRQNDGTEIR